MTVDEKFDLLKKTIKDTGELAIAFSGGVDSTFLAAITYEILGERALAVTALSPTYATREQNEANDLAKLIGIKHETVESNELEIPGFSKNPADRCYHCKKELFETVAEIAGRHGIDHVADGTNADDLNDYRPGRRAAEEHNVLSPLMTAGLTKEEIRILSRRMSLRTAEKPAMACLASRFPYGTAITEDRLKMIERVENKLSDLGFSQFRVRFHTDLARIEVNANDIEKLAKAEIRAKIVESAEAAGFTYVSLDLKGYRTGSMNETL